MSSEFKHTIVAEASGPEGVYQRITFEQFYDSSSEQVENQERLFTSVVAGVTQAAMGHRDGNA